MKRPIEEIVGDNVRRIRNDLHLSQRRFAEKAGVSQRVISNIEQGGGAGASSIRIIEQVACAIGIPAYLLMMEGLTWDKARIERMNTVMSEFGTLSDHAQSRIVELIHDYRAMSQ